MPITTYTRISCDRCGAQREYPTGADSIRATQLNGWVELRASDATGPGLGGADLPQFTVLCKECRGALVKWLAPPTDTD